MNIQQLQPGGVQSRRNDVRAALQHFVTKVMVLLAFRAQAIGVTNSIGALKCQWYGGETEDQPRSSPPPTVCTLLGRVLHQEFNGNRTVADEIEFIGRIACCAYNVFLAELDVLAHPVMKCTCSSDSPWKNGMFLNH